MKASFTIVLLCASCTQATSDPPPVAPRPFAVTPADTATGTSKRPSTPPTKGTAGTPQFGEARWGFVEASSRDGRFALLRRFKGNSPPSFGAHGEASVASELTLFDRATGTQRSLDDVIDVAGRQYFLLVAGGTTLLLDSTTGSYVKVPADGDADENACMPPRQATFSARGKRVAWLERGSKSLRVRDLESGDEWSVSSKKRIWRGWPEDKGRDVTLAEVDVAAKGWPYRHTSCACRWCVRFARSYGFYRWTGPAFKIQRVATDGSRSDAKPPSNDEPWHGKTDAGCSLVAADKTRHGLERGPWHWSCP